ncbi:right-handed parallel beta-helix repeat-containing protein, partial [bacterium]|nr:right-handed parallel beta-helix repeat-containing protein [bacterium]
SYPFLFLGETIPEPTELVSFNTLTGAPAQVARHDDWLIASVDSYHPWTHPKIRETADLISREMHPLSDRATRPQARETVVEGPELHLTDTWLVPENETVFFRAGTTVRLDPDVSILSYGRLVCEGTPDRPVVFERANPDMPWGVIAMQGSGANDSFFAHTVFQGGADAQLRNVNYTGMVSSYYAENLTFTHCLFEDNSRGDDTLHVAKGSADVLYCEFQNANGDAIDYDYGRGTIRGVRFFNTRNDAVDLMTSEPVIQGIVVQGAGDKGVSIGEHSDAIIVDSLIRDAVIGIEIKDGSEPLIVNCDIQGIQYGIHQYSKSWYYADGGHGRVYNTVVTSPGPALNQDAYSDFQAYNSILWGVFPIETQPGKLSLVDCIEPEREKDIPQAVASLQSDPRILAQIGLARLDPPTPAGLLKAPQTAQPRRVLFTDTWREDFTTRLGKWHIKGDAALAAKSARVLALRAQPGKEACLVRKTPEIEDSLAFLILEMRAPAEPDQSQTPGEPQVQVRLIGRNDQALSEQTLTPTDSMREWILPLPQTGLDRIEVVLPPNGRRIDLRRVEAVTTE